MCLSLNSCLTDLWNMPIWALDSIRTGDLYAGITSTPSLSPSAQPYGQAQHSVFC